MSSKSTILKHGQYISDIERKIVRFNKGSQSLMRVEKTEIDSFGKRLYGTNIIGDYHAAYAADCELADECELKLWKSTESDRYF